MGQGRVYCHCVFWVMQPWKLVSECTLKEPFIMARSSFYPTPHPHDCSAKACVSQLQMCTLEYLRSGQKCSLIVNMIPIHRNCLPPPALPPRPPPFKNSPCNSLHHQNGAMFHLYTRWCYRLFAHGMVLHTVCTWVVQPIHCVCEAHEGGFLCNLVAGVGKAHHSLKSFCLRNST